MATTTAREIERTYELPQGREVPELGGLPGVASESDPDTLTLEATYFDTPELRLARNGVTLRRRTGGDDDGWHLKLPAGKDTRDEVRAPLGRGAKSVPAPLAKLLPAFTRGQQLAPIARIVTTRRRRRLMSDSGGVLAEVVADEVAGQTMGASATVLSWTEVEVELAEGEPDLLDAVDARLAESDVRPAPIQSKLIRLLGDRVSPGGDTRGRPRKSGSGKATAGDGVVAYLREQVRTLVAYDPRVRRDEPDAVHKMRVATRRIRTALTSFGQVVDRDATAGIADELRWLAGVLGEARDLEVLHDRLSRRLDEYPDELVAGPVRARLDSDIAARTAEARKQLLSALTSDRYFSLLEALDKLVEEPPLRARAARPARKVLPKLVRRTWKRTDRRIATAVGEQPGQRRDEAIHEARKAAKRARYAGETVRPVFGRDAKRFAGRMEEVQEELGAHQDSVVARQAIRELGMRAQLAGENGFTFGLLYGAEQATAASVEDRLRTIQRRTRNPKLRRWLT